MAAYEVGLENRMRVKWREPGLVVLWTILTLGVYNAVWYLRINRELRDFGAAHGDEELASGKPMLSLLAVSIGILVIVPPFVSWVRCTQRIRRAQGIAGVKPISDALIVLCIVLGCFSVAGWLGAVAFSQDALNKIWKGYAGKPGPRGEVSSSGALPSLPT